MKKLVLLPVLLLIAGMVFAGGGSQPSGGTAASTAKPVELIYTCSSPAGDTQVRGANLFKETVERISGGQITVNVYDSGSLFKQEQELAAVKTGQADIANLSAPWFTAAAPWMSMFAAGYMFKSPEHWNKVLNGEIGKQVFERLVQEVGVRPLGAEYFGTRQLNLVEDKPIRTPADLRGVNLRMPNTDSWLFLGRAMGANPTPLSVSEIYMALQTKAIDGQENPLPSDINSKFYEVTKSITLTNHMSDGVYITINEAKWQSMTQQQKDWVMTGVKTTLDWCWETLRKTEVDAIQFMKDQGLKVYEADIDAFSKQVLDQYLNSDYAKTWDMDLFNKIQAAAN
jgi:tripartite ATP-independent transporter DctP family solute receptor